MAGDVPLKESEIMQVLKVLKTGDSRSYKSSVNYFPGQTIFGGSVFGQCGYPPMRHSHKTRATASASANRAYVLRTGSLPLMQE